MEVTIVLKPYFWVVAFLSQKLNIVCTISWKPSLPNADPESAVGDYRNKVAS